MPRDADTIERDADGLRAKLTRAIGLLLDRQRDIRILFLGEDGALTEAAVRWLDRLARDNFVHRTTFHEDAREHARREGQREAAMKIIASVGLDPTRMSRLSEQLKEFEDG